MEKAEIVITPGQLNIITKTIKIGVPSFMALVESIDKKSIEYEYYLNIIHEPEFSETDFINILESIRVYLTNLRKK
jgi:hypothetical protein